MDWMDGETHVPGMIGPACPQIHSAGATPPALLPVSDCKAPLMCMPLHQTLERPFNKETRTSATLQSSPAHQLRSRDVGHVCRDQEPQNAG